MINAAYAGIFLKNGSGAAFGQAAFAGANSSSAGIGMLLLEVRHQVNLFYKSGGGNIDLLLILQM